MAKRHGMIFAIIFLLAAVIDLLIPWLVGGMVARGMTGLTGSEQVTAEVSKSPSVFMFGGEFDYVRIKVLDAKVDKIAFAELDTTLRDLDIDMGALYNKRTVVVESVRDVDLTAVITQEELSRYLNQSVKSIKNAQVSVSGGRVKVSASFLLGQIASVAIVLDGKIVGDGHKISFVTERFLLNNTAVGNIGGTVLTDIQLVDLRKLPFGVKARQVTMENGKVTIQADNRGQ